MIGGATPYLKFWIKLIALERNRRFSFYFIYTTLFAWKAANNSI